MSKTFKISGIILFSVTGLQVMRIISSLTPLSDNLSGWIFSFMMQCLFLGLFPFLLYKATIKDGDFFKDVLVKTKINPISYPLAIVIGLLTYFINVGFSAFWGTFLTNIGFTYVSGGGTLFTSPEVLILEIITSCMLPAIFEEIVDRGLLIANLENVKSDTAKIIIVGLFFGACHQNAPQFGPTALAGVIIGYMAIKSGSILPGMIVHFMNNFLITISNYLSQKGLTPKIITQLENFVFLNGLTVLFALAVSGIALVFVLYFFEKINTKPENRKPKNEIEETIMAVYGIPCYDKNGMPIYYAKQNDTSLPLESKAKATDYVLLVVAFVSALAVTAFTFFWGLLR